MLPLGIAHSFLRFVTVFLPLFCTARASQIAASPHSINNPNEVYFFQTNHTFFSSFYKRYANFSFHLKAFRRAMVLQPNYLYFFLIRFTNIFMGNVFYSFAQFSWFVSWFFFNSSIIHTSTSCSSSHSHSSWARILFPILCFLIKFLKDVSYLDVRKLIKFSHNTNDLIIMHILFGYAECDQAFRQLTLLFLFLIQGMILSLS